MMDPNEKSRSGSFGLKTESTVNAIKAFSRIEHSTNLEHVACIVEELVKPGKVVRLFKCFSCGDSFAPCRMSHALVVCKDCLQEARAKGRIARRNQLDRIVNAVSIHLRSRLEA